MQVFLAFVGSRRNEAGNEKERLSSASVQNRNQAISNEEWRDISANTRLDMAFVPGPRPDLARLEQGVAQ